jgi:hypothetical protein
MNMLKGQDLIKLIFVSLSCNTMGISSTNWKNKRKEKKVLRPGLASSTQCTEPVVHDKDTSRRPEVKRWRSHSD